MDFSGNEASLTKPSSVTLDFSNCTSAKVLILASGSIPASPMFVFRKSIARNLLKPVSNSKPSSVTPVRLKNKPWTESSLPAVFSVSSVIAVSDSVRYFRLGNEVRFSIPASSIPGPLKVAFLVFGMPLRYCRDSSMPPF